MSEFTTPSGRFYRWPRIIAYCRRNPGWHRLLPNAPARVVKTVRLRRHPQLRVEGGWLEASIMHVYQDPDGVQRGDIYLQWHPSRGYDTLPIHHEITPTEGREDPT